MTKIQEPERLIKQLSANTTELLASHWPQVVALCGTDEELKIGIAHTVTDDGMGELTTKSTISFGCRIKDVVEHTIDASQGEFEL